VNITVFAATGAIGELVVDDLLHAGHTVRGYARNPDKVPATWPGRVDVTIGDIGDADAIDHAVDGSNAVISALGPSLNRKAHGLPLIEGTQHIVDAMHRHQVRRYIGLATPSVLDPRDKPTLQARLVGMMGRTMLSRAYRELLGMSAIITESDLDWTIVRFIAPTDGPAKGIQHQGFFGTDRIGWRVTRADIAAFTAAQITDTTYLGAAPAISN
jgi:uncharacterized protein YbjT (DUF2867 family)